MDTIKFDFKGHAVRTQAENGIVWFNAQDVVRALGYKKTSNAIQQHCKLGGALKRDTLTSSGIQQMLYINEPNLYRLIAHSKLPSAEAFEGWIFEEVIPAVVKHGGYISPRATGKQLAKLTKRIEELERLDAVFGCRTRFAEPSKRTGLPKVVPVRGHLRSPKGRYILMDTSIIQLLFPFEA